MPKLEWGKKHICSECNTKFYDMSKSTPECPKCGSQVLITRKPRVGRPPLSQKKPKPTETIKEDKNKDVSKSLVVEKVDVERNIEGIEHIEEIEDIAEDIGEIGEIEEIENIEEDEDADEMEKTSDPSFSNNIKSDNG